jgi:hypothetical protein
MTKKTIRTADKQKKKIKDKETEKIAALKAPVGTDGVRSSPEEFSIRAFAVLARAVNEIHASTGVAASKVSAAEMDKLLKVLDRLMAIKKRSAELEVEVRRGKFIDVDRGW